MVLFPSSLLMRSFKNALVRYKIEAMETMRETSQQRITWGRRKEECMHVYQ